MRRAFKLNSLKEIEKNVLENTTAQDREVRGLWGIDCLFNPVNNGRIFDYKILVSQTIGQGSAYSMNDDYPRDFLKQYVGRDFLECDITDVALKVCLLDSVYGVRFPAKSKKRLIADSDSITKMHWRTQTILDEAKYLLGGVKGKKVVNVGVVGDILKTFDSSGAFITGTDYDPSIVGVGDIPIKDGGDTLKVIAESDLAIITGMTITSDTIDEILDRCHTHGVKTIVFAETGASLAGYYVNRGVDVFLSEYFPFYIYNGISVMDVCYG